MPTTKFQRRRAILLLYAAAVLLFVTQSGANAADDAKKTADLMISEKRIEKEKEKSMLKYFIDEGKRFFADGNYDGATEQFSRALEINPDSADAKRGINTAQVKMGERRKTESPSVMAKKLLKSGQEKYRAKDFDGAVLDFQNALVLDYENEDILEWLKRTRRQGGMDKARMGQKDLDRDMNLATEEKTVQEKTAMLEVEKAYLPPVKPERKPVEIEEIISPEEERDEKARQALMKKLSEKMVPAVSLSEADIRDVIRQLMDITNVTIVIDEGALAKAGEGAPLKITFSTVSELPLLEVLNIALRATDLSYRVEPSYIWISTPDKLAKENLVTKTYRLKYGVRRVRKIELEKFEAKSSSDSGS